MTEATNPKMHADEVAIDAKLVAKLVTEQFPQWSTLSVSPVESAGTSNAIYRLGKDMCVRLPRIASAAKHVSNEFEWMPKLAPLLPVAIPAPLVKGEPAASYPWSWTVCPWLEGDNPTEGQLTNPGAVAADLSRFIAALHKVVLPGGPPSKRGQPLSTQDPQVRDALKALHGKIDTVAAEAAWEQALQTPQWTGSPVWLHGDLMPGNILVKDGHLSAVLDFGCLGVGDPASDLIPAWNLFSSDDRDDFKQKLQVDEATWGRGKGWAFSMALIQLPYYEQTNPTMAANARYVINQVLASK